MKTLLLFMVVWGHAGHLVINSDQSDPVPKKAFQSIIKIFEKENPQIKVSYNVYDQEAYKTSIRNWLTASPPDIVHWFAGNRMRQFVKRDLFYDLSELWKDKDISKNMHKGKALVSFNNKQWGMPYSYYPWGVYYRKDIFKKLSLKEPQTWKEFLEVCGVLKAAKVTPLNIGTKFLWTTAAWFDYLSMRIHGANFHEKVVDGQVPYTSEKIRKIFDYWHVLIKEEYFLKNHGTYSWQEAIPYFLNGKTAMVLLGNFATQSFGKEKKHIGFFPFPKINDVITGEDAPMDTLHIPKKAKNIRDAFTFLRFIARKDIQAQLNRDISQIPIHKEASMAKNRFLEKGVELFRKTQKLMQFYDRDTSPRMAKEGMKGFQEFMIKPQRRDKILSRLERIRRREFKIF